MAPEFLVVSLFLMAMNSWMILGTSLESPVGPRQSAGGTSSHKRPYLAMSKSCISKPDGPKAAASVGI